MGRKRKDGKFVNCYLSSNLVDTLEVASEETGKSKTRIIEDALTEHFTKNGFLEADNSFEETISPGSDWFVPTEPQKETQAVSIPRESETERWDSADKTEPEPDIGNGKPAVLSTAEGAIPCTILEELDIYGEPYYRIQTGEGIKKVHRSFVKKLS